MSDSEEKKSRLDALEEEKKRRLALLAEDEQGEGGGDSGTETGTGTGSGGQGGAIEFRDFVFIRNDKYTAEEERQLLSMHKDASGNLIEKQKKLRDQRQSREQNRNRNNQIGQGMDARDNGFIKHPILGEKAEFDGIDPQVNADPTIYEAETNSEKREELVYQHQLRLGLQNQPHFNPKPSPF